MSHGSMRVQVGPFVRQLDGSHDLTVGRGHECDVRLENPKVSRLHCRVWLDPVEGWIFEDEASANGSFVGPQRVRRRVIDGALSVRLGHPEVGEELRLEPAGRAGAPVSTPAPGEAAVRSVRLLAGVTRIGRDPDNDIVVVDDLLVSRRHAEIHRGADGVVVVTDTASHNGTFVNGRRVSTQRLQDADVVGVGRHSFRLDHGDRVVVHVDDGQVRFEASGLSFRTTDGKTILDDVSFSLPPGSLLVVAGPSGAGKSTLMKALAGTQPPTAGSVRYAGLDFYASYDELRTRMGYVPQDDILHPQLGLRQALLYAAELRFPADSSGEAREERVDEILVELGLQDHAGQPISQLSGGQRKRTNVAQELLTKPSLLLLDEPTTGLDPGAVKSVMRLLRELADGGPEAGDDDGRTMKRTVIVITHSFQSIELCDLVLMLAPGGKTAYLGPPADMLAYFDRTESADVFQDLQHRAPTESQSRFRSHPLYGRHTPGRAPVPDRQPCGPPLVVPARRQPLQPWPHQLGTLARRQAAVLTSDWRNFLFLALGVVLPGLAVLALVGRGSLDETSAPHPDARVLLLALVVSATSIAAANSLREIVKEQPIYQRDRSAGMAIAAYLGSKFVVLGIITSVQVAVLVLIGTAGAQATPPARGIIVVSMVLASFATTALCLLISSLVGTSEKAMALIAVMFVGQWLFSGAAISLVDKPPLQAVGYVTSANWGLAAAAAGVDLHRLEQRCLGIQTPRTRVTAGAGPASACDARWRPGLAHLGLNLWALVLLSCFGAFATHAALRRKDPMQAGRRGRGGAGP